MNAPKFRIKQRVSVGDIKGTIVDRYAISDIVLMYVLRTEQEIRTLSGTTKMIHVPEGALADLRTDDEIVLGNLKQIEEEALDILAEQRNRLMSASRAELGAALTEQTDPAFRAQATLSIVDDMTKRAAHEEFAGNSIRAVERVCAGYLLDEKFDMIPHGPIGLSLSMRDVYKRCVIEARQSFMTHARTWPGYDEAAVERLVEKGLV